MTKLIYQPETKTIRTTPENYCVAAIATFSEGGHTDAAISQPEAIFKLMAASPEMLQALEGIVASFHQSITTKESLESFPALKACVDAINKAKGA